MKDRLIYLDYARVIAAFLVVYAHFYSPDPNNYVRSFIYFFHMPFFFLVSGMLHKFNGEIQLKKYAKGLLIPMVFFSILFVITDVFLLCSGAWPGAMQSFYDESLLTTCGNFLKEKMFLSFTGKRFINGPCWFLLALFYCKVLTDIIEKKKILGFSIWLTLFVGLALLNHRYLFVACSMMAMPFYYIGFRYKEKINELMNTKINILVYLALVLIFAIGFYKLTVVSMMGVSFGKCSQFIGVPFFYVNGFIGSFILLKLSACFKKESYVSKMACSLISILGLQTFLLLPMKAIIGSHPNYFLTILLSLVVVLICHYCHLFIVKYIPFVLGKF